MSEYNHQEIEKKWQRKWQENKIYQVDLDKAKKPFYNLMMFPYPSAEGLHVGNMYAFVHSDAYGRFMRLQGFDVFEPIGLDGFGIHSENYAIKIKEHIRDVSARTEKHFYEQLHMIGNAYDWSRTVETYKPNYYKWTQWLFLQMYKKGLAYRKKSSVNWCPSCKTVLSDEQVISGSCERCHTATEKREMDQWFWKITNYADQLLKNLKEIDWSEEVKTIQKNWIGKSEGLEEDWQVEGMDLKLKTFTTWPHTTWGATFMVIAPEHPIIDILVKGTEYEQGTKDFCAKVIQDKIKDPENVEKNKEGFFIGRYVINPLSGRRMPLYIANFAIYDYGTGIVKCTPAHDERDYEFAEKYTLDFVPVIAPLFDIKNGPDAVRSDKKTDRRRTIYALVKHYKEDKYLCLDWEKFNWHSGIIGGIEESEDVVEAAKREIQEETGYQNLKLIKQYKGEIHNHFFASHKDVNHYAIGHGFVFELLDDKKVATEEEHTKFHKLVWIDGKKMSTFLNLPVFQYLWTWANGGTDCYTSEGVMINARQFDGMPTEKARQAIGDYSVAHGHGRWTTNYKLRDWCVSRQRYWGPPIPMVYCSNCANTAKNISSVFTFHAIAETNKEHWYSWLNEELEKQGIKSVTPLMPSPDQPKIEDWLEVAEKSGLDENSVVVGRSLGARAALKFAESHKLKKLVLLCATLDGDEKYWESIKAGYPDFPITSARKFNATKIDYQKVQKNVGEIIFLFSHNDPYIPQSFEEYYRENLPQAQFVIYQNAGHFGAGDGFTTFPDLFKYIFGENPGWIPVPEKDLPVLLPEVEDFLPNGSGKGPLNKVKDFVKTTCPQCGGPAERETDVSDPFVDSCWYYLRYPSTEFADRPFDKKRLVKWLPVSMYIGGKEHSVLHLLYSRFVTMVMHDLGYAPEEEPFKKFRAHGLLIRESAKMSKSKGNVINPDEYIEKFGADAVRLYLMFLGDMRQGGDWQDKGMAGVAKFVPKVYNLFDKIKQEKSGPELVRLLHQTVKGVAEDLENLKYNTAIAKLMILSNKIQEVGCTAEEFGWFLILLAPFMPHLAEELWEKLGNKESIFKASWPKYDSKLVKEEEITLVVQINGKVRENLVVAADISEAEAKKLVLASEKVQKWLEGKEPKKMVFVPGKLISIVI